MAEEVTVKKDNKKLIYIIAGAVAAVALIVAIILIVSNKGIDDSYFVSTDTKYVLTTEDNSYGATKRHMVVEYTKEDKITKMEEYIEFDSNKTAKEVYDEMEEYYNQDDMKEYKPDYRINGKYIINTYDESEYAEMSASDVKQILELYNADGSDIVESDEVEE